MAVDGDGTALTAVVEPDIAYDLLRPARAAPWQLAPGPGVTQIEVWDLEPDREPPELRAQFRFAGPGDSTIQASLKRSAPIPLGLILHRDRQRVVSAGWSLLVPDETIGW